MHSAKTVARSLLFLMVQEAKIMDVQQLRVSMC